MKSYKRFHQAPTPFQIFLNAFKVLAHIALSTGLVFLERLENTMFQRYLDATVLTLFLGCTTFCTTRCLFFFSIFLLFYIFEISISIFLFVSFFFKTKCCRAFYNPKLSNTPKFPINFCNPRVEN